MAGHAFAALALLAGCTDPTRDLVSEQEEIRRVDYASDHSYYSALRTAAFQEMHRMPPDEFRRFHMRNAWEARWPELWGPEGFYQNRIRGIPGPPAAPTPERNAHLRALADSLLAHGAFGTGPNAEAEAREFVRDIIRRAEEGLAEYIDQHARRWPESAWK